MTPATKAEKVQVRDASDGRCYVLDVGTPVGGGGEAFVYAVHGEPGLLAKVYKKRSADIGEKLQVMLASPPRNPMEKIGHPSYAWPTALICGPKESTVIGFLMQRVTGMRDVFAFYNPNERRRTCPLFTYHYLLQAGRNIAGIMHEVHSKGYVVGDVNQKNIFVSDSALVTLIDNDSFQIRDPRTGRLHLCRVRTDGFIAPELYRTSQMHDVERTVEQDLFGLAVVIFHLLMEGVHPFSYIFTGQGDPPTLQERVREGKFPYAPGRRLKPMRTAPPFDMLNPDVRALFLRCFVDGHGDPKLRPTAKEWQEALSKATQALQTCTANQQHRYGAHLGNECPWCARVQARLHDSFPPPGLVKPISPKPKEETGTRVRRAAPQKKETGLGKEPFRSVEKPSNLRAGLVAISILVAILLLAARGC